MRMEFLGTPLDALSKSETLELILASLHARRQITHSALNVAKLVKMRSNPLLRQDVTSSDIIGVDGMGIVWGARALGMSVPERVAGIDLMLSVLEECARRGYRPFFLGASAEVVRRAAEVATSRYPGLVLAGCHDGYFKPQDDLAVVEAINASGADCLFVGMPTPRKERFLAAYRSRISVPFVMGVGGSFDVLAGKVRRAPLWVQKVGLEWLFRVAQEPRRMIGRYAWTNTIFMLLIVRELASVSKTRASRERTS